jgi:hypothetical protein
MYLQAIRRWMERVSIDRLLCDTGQALLQPHLVVR